MISRAIPGEGLSAVPDLHGRDRRVLEMLGICGYGRATKRTLQDALELIQRQREVRANLLALDETNKTGSQRRSNVLIENNA